MKQPLIVKKEKTIKASPAEIWEVLTTPALFEKWMLVPGEVPGNGPLQMGSIIQWKNEEQVAYLTGKVIKLAPGKVLAYSLQDISWPEQVPEGTVTYQFRMQDDNGGTRVTFTLGDISIDPEAAEWYEAYDGSDEIGSIEQLVQQRRK